MDTATAERPLKAVGDEDDGLGPPSDPPINPDSPVDDGSGIPGGAQPGDEGYDDPPGPEDPPQEPPAQGPPTPPADLPNDGEGDEEPQDDQLALLGERELGLKVGGRKPDSCVLKYKGGKIELGGPKGSQFDRGDRFLTVDTWQVTGDNDQDTINKLSGEVKSTSKAQNATLCGTERIEDWLAAKLREGLSEDEAAKAFDALGLEMPAPEGE